MTSVARQAKGKAEAESDEDDEEIVLFKKPVAGTSVVSSMRIAESGKDDLSRAATPHHPLSESQVLQMLSKLQIPQQPSSPLPPSVLLILDVNGILVWREMLKGGGGKEGASSGQGLVPDWRKVKNFRVWNRPGLQSFLDFCLDRFVLAIWSSTRKDNLEPIVEDIFKEKMKRLLFVWNQDDCFREERPKEGFPLFLKDLDKVWKRFPQFSCGKTLLVDDDAPKAKRNPQFTCVHPTRWTCAEVDDAMLEPDGEIRSYLEALANESQLPSFAGVEAFVQSHSLT